MISPDTETALAEDDFDPREMYPLIANTVGEAGWNDPTMDGCDTIAPSFGDQLFQLVNNLRHSLQSDWH
jgi:hypothetical protein